MLARPLTMKLALPVQDTRRNPRTTRRGRRWLACAALVLVVPKCLLCLAGYIGATSALGASLSGIEWCGEPAALRPDRALTVILAGATLTAGLLLFYSCRRGGGDRASSGETVATPSARVDRR